MKMNYKKQPKNITNFLHIKKMGWTQEENQLYYQYAQELREANTNKISSLPKHLYSKRVYRAYHDKWYMIDRRLLTQDEIQVMKELGVYKESRSKRGIPRYLSRIVKI